MIFRHKDKYFVDYIAKQYNNTPYQQRSRTDIQWITKTRQIDIDSLVNLGWTPRNADKRYLPSISDLNSFLRAYIEVHGKLGYCTAYNRKGEKYYKLRLRIYGNKNLLIQIAQCISSKIQSEVSSIEKTTADKSGILNYTKYEDIQNIFNLVSGLPQHVAFWQNIDEMMQTPTKNSQ
jgi:hypothetical protein